MERIFPVTIKNPFPRASFPGKPEVEGTQHPMMLQGMMLDRSVSDAQFAISDGIKQLQKEINSYLSLNMVSQSAMPGKNARPALLMMDIIMFIKNISEFIQQIMGLVKAILGVIGHIQSLANNIIHFIQARLNAIATLLNELCNLTLPDLPAIPSIFGDLNFDGFAFPSGAFKFALKFDTNFAFGSCHWRKPNLDILRNYPPTKFGLDPSGHFGPQVGTNTNPPLPSSFYATPGPAQKLSDWVAAQDATTQAKPVFRPDWVPNESSNTADTGSGNAVAYNGFSGSLPHPGAIITPYAVPFEQFKDQIISLIGGPVIDLNPAGTTGKSTLVVSVVDDAHNIEYWRQQLQPAVKAFAKQSINLEGIVASKTNSTTSAWAMDTTVDWKLVWAWLVYLHQCREGRGGVWIQAYEEVYQNLILPSFQEIEDKPVPWHSQPDDASAVTTGFSDILYFVKTLSALNAQEQKTMLWKLSYVEAAILGCARSTIWDDGAVTGYITGATRDDLDYKALALGSSTEVNSFFLDSKGLANYPSSIVDVPHAASSVVEEVIATAYRAICRVAPNFTASIASNRYAYTQFAETIEINSHSQFWKEFRSNWVLLRQMDTGLQAICFNYPEVLDSAINPLTEHPEIFLRVKADYLNRTPGWSSGNPSLPSPYIPVVTLAGSDSIYVIQDKIPTGWGDTSDASKDHNMVTGTGAPIELTQVQPDGTLTTTKFDPAAFLLRPDVQAMPPNYQSTATYLNQAYSDLLAHQATTLNDLNQQIGDAFGVGSATIAYLEELVGGFNPQDIEFTGSLDKLLNDIEKQVLALLNPPKAPDTNPGMTFFYRALMAVTQVSYYGSYYTMFNHTDITGIYTYDPGQVYFLQGLNRWLIPYASNLLGQGVAGEISQPPAVAIESTSGGGGGNHGGGGGGGSSAQVITSIQDPALVFFFRGLLVDIKQSQKIADDYLMQKNQPSPEARASLLKSLKDIGIARATTHTCRLDLRVVKQTLGAKPKPIAP